MAREEYDITLDPQTGEIVEQDIPEDWEEMGNDSTALAPVKAQAISVDTPPKLFAPDELPDLDGMEQGFKLEAKYIEFEEKGQSERGVFLGFTKMKSQNGDRMIDMANFQNKDGVWVNSGANLTNQLRDRNVPPGTPLLVTYLGKKETKSGNKVKTYEVRLLNYKTPPPVPDMAHLANADPVKAGRR